MSTIEPRDIKPVHADHFSQQAAGESATVITTGVVIHPEIQGRMPHETYITPMTSSGDTHSYHAVVRGYTMAQFIAIVTAFADGQFEQAESLINELAPKGVW